MGVKFGHARQQTSKLSCADQLHGMASVLWVAVKTLLHVEGYISGCTPLCIVHNT